MSPLRGIPAKAWPFENERQIGGTVNSSWRLQTKVTVNVWPGIKVGRDEVVRS